MSDDYTPDTATVELDPAIVAELAVQHDAMFRDALQMLPLSPSIHDRVIDPVDVPLIVPVPHGYQEPCS